MTELSHTRAVRDGAVMDLADPKWSGKWGAAPGGADFQAIVAGLATA